ncbi:MAG: lamin tail domain-containing protein [Patescibacteria group bacterium]|nr:lamin tail domain-containing protein [Patescibacteria group bacterium]
MRQYKTELSIIVVLLFFWEVEFFVFDILPCLAQTKLEITEIMYDLPGSDDKHEWVEIHNNGTETIDLTDWKFNDGDTATNHGLNAPPKNNSRGSLILAAGEYALLAGDAATLITDLPAYQGTIIDTIIDLSNTSSILKLLNKDGTEVDTANYDKAIGAAGNGKTLEKNNAGLWQESLMDGGTPGEINSRQGEDILPPEEPSTPPENPNQDTAPAVNFILINELLPDPVNDDHEGEYVELFNNSDTTADISLWELRDESENKKEKPSGFIIEVGTTIPALSYRAFYTGKEISLNNDKNGDTVYLIKENQVTDKITYLGPAPTGESYNRQTDNTWAWSATATPGLQNIIATKDDPVNAIPNKSYPRHIWINEFFPNPKGKDAENEFIEIYNPGPAEINLANWQIDDQENKGSHPYTFPENFIIKRGDYLTLPYSQTKISLNNNSDWVRLLWPNGQAIDEVPYSDPREGESYNKTNNGWSWSCNTTPGEPNKIVSDEECAASPEEETKDYSRALWINEFLPDPKGKDEEGEFIELQNRGEEEIDLTNWQIDDCESAGSKPHTFPENTKIKANSYLVLYYKETKISLNNNGDCVRLLNPLGQAVDEIKYSKAKEGQSYSRQNVDHWQWTDNPTPGKDNGFPQILAAKITRPKTPENQTQPNQQKILPQTGPNMYFYYSPVFLFFFIFYLTKIKKYCKNENCSFIKSA